jgi:hypothetical protein
MTEWQTISTAPEKDFFLAWDGDDNCVVMAFRNGPDEILTMNDCIHFNATHWMPLPGPPSKEIAPVLAENMLKQSLREGWQVQAHPVRWLRGKDHG